MPPVPILRNNLTIVVQTEADPLQIVGALREQIWSLDRDQTVANVATMDTAVSESLQQPRFALLLLGIFAGVALLLASVGLYGVVSYAVGQRTRELGIRMAMGADGGELLSLVLRQGLGLVGVGVAVGVAVSFAEPLPGQPALRGQRDRPDHIRRGPRPAGGSRTGRLSRAGPPRDPDRSDRSPPSGVATALDPRRPSPGLPTQPRAAGAVEDGLLAVRQRDSFVDVDRTAGAVVPADPISRRVLVGTRSKLYVLLAATRLGDEAYGGSIRREIEARTGRPVSIGALYTTLGRLGEKGLLTQEASERDRSFLSLSCWA